MSQLPLTVRQEQLWRYIRSCERSPTYSEMALALYGNVNAKGRVNILISALKERGFVDYIPNRARSIVALDPPASTLSILTAASATTEALLSELYRRGIGVVVLPLHGRIS